MVWDLKKDIACGTLSERKVISWFNKNIYQNDWIKAYKNNTKQVDFCNNSIIGELKSRFNNHDSYPDTMFGMNKIDYLLNQVKKGEERELKFFFLFTDGLYEWTYHEDQYEERSFNHKEKGYKPYAYVKHEYLKKLTSDITMNSPLPEDMDKYIIDSERFVLSFD
tara:strand:+ start:19759 stop:20253 length:495 start_codon:yes stop_codon:yes gene_type:complete